jgi:hypothetical protein
LRAQQGVTAQNSPEGFHFDAPSPGLSQRDYIPLMIAIFVDVCIFLVSINRPFGPFFNLGEAMKRARGRGPMQRVFATFYQVFQDSFGANARPTPLRLIAPVQDVVFDYKGDYHAAVPLDFREENYQRWLIERRERGEVMNGDAPGIFDPRNPESFQPLETSRYIASIFAVLEGEGLVRLLEQAPESGAQASDGGRMGLHFGNGASDLNTARIRDRLDEQGSVYGQADSFRLYRFRRGAWPALLMEVVGSSAEYEEVEQRRSSRSQRRLFGLGAPDAALSARPRRDARSVSPTKGVVLAPSCTWPGASTLLG